MVGFATLMIRLEVTQEGYRLSKLHDDIAKLEDENRGLRLTAAQLSSHDRLRALAPKYHLAPPGARAGGDAAMNTSFKQRRTRIGALTFTLAALFGSR